MKIKRRDFLKIGAAASVLAGSSETSEATEQFAGYPNSNGMLFDTTLCLGSNCRRCEEACKKANDLDTADLDLTDNSVFDELRRTDASNYTVVNRFVDPSDADKAIFVKRQCMHCQEPACVSACLVKAFTKTPEGSVIYDKDLCIGCRYCMVACPFYAPTYDYFDAYSPEVRKCTMCHDRILEGKKPACADVCPEEAITFGKRSELIELAREKIRNHPDKYRNHIYGEKEVGGTSWLYMAGTDFADIGFDMGLGETRYPMLTRGFLSVVPLVLTIWPVFLVGLYKATQHRQQLAENTEHHPERGDQ